MARYHSWRIYPTEFSQILVFYALFVMQVYLTDVWGLSFTHSAAILNIWGGLLLILPGFFLYLVDTCLGHLRMMMITTISSCVGTGFIAISTPPLLGNATGMCKEYEPNCIGHAHRVLFYIGMALVAIGTSGYVVSIKVVDDDESDDDEVSNIQRFIIPIIGLIGAIVLPLIINPWSIHFGIPAIFTTFTTLVFFSGCRQYKSTPPQGSPITNVLRVLVATVSKTSKPSHPKLYMMDGKEQITFTRTRFLRCLEKAAIYNQNDDLSNKWKFCTMAEVEEAKIILRMIPMWTTFIMLGIVSSLQNTYFVEQSNHMNRKGHHLNRKGHTPIQILMLIFMTTKSLFNFDALVLSWKEPTQNSPISAYQPRVGTESAFGIGVSMILSVLCCITAARIEKLRLDVITQHGLVDRPDDDIPMSMFWLLFQFVLLSGVEAYLNKSVEAFYAYQAPSSMKEYLNNITEGMTGLGYMFSVLTVYYVGQVSEKGGKTNWFQPTLNRSRLDKYYWVLAALCAVNFVIFMLVAYMYRYRDCEAIDDAGADKELPMAEMAEDTETRQ